MAASNPRFPPVFHLRFHSYDSRCIRPQGKPYLSTIGPRETPDRLNLSTTRRGCCIFLSMPKTLARIRPSFHICAFCFLAAIASPAQQPATAPIVLHAARLLEVDTGTLLQPGEILVEGDRIRAVGKSVDIRRAQRSSTSATSPCFPASSTPTSISSCIPAQKTCRPSRNPFHGAPFSPSRPPRPTCWPVSPPSATWAPKAQAPPTPPSATPSTRASFPARACASAATPSTFWRP